MRRDTIGPVDVILGDCREILPSLSGIDAIISDPPYGMKNDTSSKRFTQHSEPGRRGQGGGRFSGLIPGDSTPFDPKILLSYSKVILFGSNHYSAHLPIGTTLVWIKRNEAAYGTFLSDAEILWQKGGHGVYCYKDLSMKSIERHRLHPNQKPLPLMKWCVERITKQGETVCDPYAGSGTTALACVETGRKAIAIELSEHYYDVIRRRIEQALRARPAREVEQDERGEG